MDIKEKVAIITGGVGVLGLAVSETILDMGGKVCLADCDMDRGREIETSLRTTYGSDRVLFVQCDVTVEEDIKRLFDCAEKYFGVVEILCNNAGLNGEFPPDLLVKTNFMNPNVDEIGIRFNCICPSVFVAADSKPVPRKVVGKVLDIAAFRSFKETFGCLTADRVAEGLCRLITEDRNGDALFMSKNFGTRFVALRLVDVPESI